MKKSEFWDEVENGLGSAGRIRILRILTEHPNRQYTKYALKRKTGLNSRELQRQIQMLVEIGWVKEYPHEPRTYKANLKKTPVKLVAEFFRRLKIENFKPSD